MIELYILCTLFIVILLIINTNTRLRSKRNKTKNLAQIVQSLRTLLEYLAMHRGMTNAYLKGDQSFESKILSLQKDIENSFKILTQSKTHNASLDKNKDYQEMYIMWKDLQSKAFSRVPAENFKQHISLIEKVIENIAEEGLFIEVALSDNPNTKVIANTLVTELPHYVEILGQARGIGTGAVAQGGCSIDIKMNLKYLYDEAESKYV